MLRVLPPILPTLFEKDVRLYRSLALHVKGLEITVNGRRWVLNHGKGGFRAEGSRAAELAEALRDVIGDMSYTNRVIHVSEGKALRLVEFGLARLLSEPEYEAIKRVVRRVAKSAGRHRAEISADPVTVQRLAEELSLSESEVEALVNAAMLARHVGFGGSLRYAYLYYDDEKKLNKVLEILKKIRIQTSSAQGQETHRGTEAHIHRGAEKTDKAAK